MLFYLAYDKNTGDVVHVHRSVNADGRDQTCTDEEVISLLPAHIDPGKVSVASTQLDSVPSPRQVTFRVDPASGAVIQSDVASTTAPTPASRPAESEG